MKETVEQKVLERVYEEMKTPYKYGMVLKEEGVSIDCPNVFRGMDGMWHIMYARHVPNSEREGYETWMADSSDLLHWSVSHRVLAQKESGWDCLQADGGLALLNPEWNGAQDVRSVDGTYFITYIGGALPGYETDPLRMGLASSTDLYASDWKQEPEPILREDDPDARWFEKKTIYKSCVIENTNPDIPYRFLMYYNGKREGNWKECIGMAGSNDMYHWARIGTEPVVTYPEENRFNIAGDPQLVRFGDVWVMHYFIAFNNSAWDTFACSYDLLHWTKWEGEPLIKPSEPYDQNFAHKPYVLKQDGVVYHYYCAVGDEGRGIAVATSKPLA